MFSQRIINIVLFVSSLIGYFQWGKSNSAFVFQIEYEILFRRPSINNFAHPFILIPFCGQLLLLFTLLQKIPSKLLTTISIALIGFLVILLTLIGIMNHNWKMILSILPFLFFSVLHFIPRTSR